VPVNDLLVKSRSLTGTPEAVLKPKARLSARTTAWSRRASISLVEFYTRVNITTCGGEVLCGKIIPWARGLYKDP